MKPIMPILLTIPNASMSVNAAPIMLEDIFRPLQWLEPARLYEQYSGALDLFIYALIFIGAAQVTLGRHFPGRGGKAISVGIGTALAMSMIIAEKTFNFSLSSFGPVAGTIILLLLGIMIYRLLYFAGMKGVGAASLAYIILFIASLMV